MITNFEKLVDMGKRIYNNKMVVENNEDGTIKYSDDEAIKALCSKVFDMDGNVSSMEDLRSSILQSATKKANYSSFISFWNWCRFHKDSIKAN